jgi:MFS superfamily sulfate permease-like transporter
MFAEWVTKGAEFGVEAFAAIAVFAGICFAILGMLGLGAKLLGKDEDKEKAKW